MNILRSTLFALWALVWTLLTAPLVIAGALLLRGLWGYHFGKLWRLGIQWGVEHLLGIHPKAVSYTHLDVYKRQLLDAAGNLTNKFLVVSNISPADTSAVIGGNERVVRPRLADAKFFFDQDRKKSLESRVAGLAKVVYHNKLGTQGERMQRVAAIARAIGQQLAGEALALHAEQAAVLAKADLLTDMVGEFPELQGIMGRYYPCLLYTSRCV